MEKIFQDIENIFSDIDNLLKVEIDLKKEVEKKVIDNFKECNTEKMEVIHNNITPICTSINNLKNLKDEWSSYLR
ncbi:hypothetical protein [Metabacillus dongyingensis]|uniref:hypothetical protein n=1 Tax=Metabacillus dongyingensis TaxID=2874282 RepID=UPI001CBE64D2|nr:hypothetical protein [Metabacillus dongyingensis]UAL53602.1 hypothetical protein K8L98_07410 [Metabacillus dongyingensis]